MRDRHLSFAAKKNRFNDRHKHIMDIITLHLNNALVNIKKTPSSGVAGYG